MCVQYMYIIWKWLQPLQLNFDMGDKSELKYFGDIPSHYTVTVVVGLSLLYMRA